MRNKIITVILVLIGILVAWYFVNNSDIEPKQPLGQNETNTSTSNETVQNTEPSAQIKPAKPVEQLPNENDVEKNDELLVLALASMAERRYSSDALVEVSSISQEYGYCTDFILDMKFKDIQFTDKQSKILERNQQRCDRLREKYPFLANESDRKQVTDTLNKQASSSALGDLYRDKNMPDMQDLPAYLNQTIKLGVKAKNAQVLVENTSAVNMPIFKPDPAISDVLGGLDENYFRLTQGLTMSLLSCQFQDGISCQADSQMMMDKCMVNDDFCGMSYIDWYQQHTTAAQKRDVDKLMVYYQSL